jgi:hypothetical protein
MSNLNGFLLKLIPRYHQLHLLEPVAASITTLADTAKTNTAMLSIKTAVAELHMISTANEGKIDSAGAQAIW